VTQSLTSFLIQKTVFFVVGVIKKNYCLEERRIFQTHCVWAENLFDHYRSRQQEYFRLGVGAMNVLFETVCMHDFPRLGTFILKPYSVLN
jgi:hypothetical protein